MNKLVVFGLSAGLFHFANASDVAGTADQYQPALQNPAEAHKVVADYFECLAWAQLSIDLYPAEQKHKLGDFPENISVMISAMSEITGKDYAASALSILKQNAYGELKVRSFEGQEAATALMQSKLGECTTYVEEHPGILQAEPWQTGGQLRLRLPEVEKYPTRDTHEWCATISKFDYAAAQFRDEGLDADSALKYAIPAFQSEHDQQNMRVAIVNAYQNWPHIPSSQMREHSYANCLEINNDAHIVYPLN